MTDSLSVSMKVVFDCSCNHQSFLRGRFIGVEGIWHDWVADVMEGQGYEV